MLNFVFARNGPVGRLHVSSVRSTFPGPSSPATVPASSVLAGIRRERRPRGVEAAAQQQQDDRGRPGARD